MTPTDPSKRPRISSRTALCGVVLHPAGHTRSPAMHNAAFGELGIDAAYLAFDVPPERLPGAIDGVRSMGIRQLAVSLPHKVAVMEHLDEIDETARRIGAVNTVTNREGRLTGTNSDWVGAVRALEQQAKCELSGKRAVVLGAGGSSRAVVFGLLARGAQVHVLNRTEASARQLATSLGATAAGGLHELGDLDYDVLVNSTSVGLAGDESPVPAESLVPGAVVMDTVYEPEWTRLLLDAKDRGSHPLGGKWMLVYQAAEQLQTWCEVEAPIQVMAEAFDDAGGNNP